MKKGTERRIKDISGVAFVERKDGWSDGWMERKR